MRPRSIRARLIASYLVLVSVCLIVVATFVTWRLQFQYMSYYRRVVSTQALLIGRMLQAYVREEQTASGRLETIAQEFRWRQDATIRVLDPAVAAAQGQAGAGELAAAVAQRRAADAVRADADGGVRIFAAAPVMVGERPVGVVQVSVPTRWVWVQLQGMLPWLGAALLLGLVAAWAVGTRLARSLAEPIDELTRVASQMSAGDLTRTVRPRGTDEIVRLGEMFNAMAERLAGTIQTLSAERTKLEAIVSGMVDGVIAADRRGQIILANRAAAELLELSPAGPDGPWPRVTGQRLQGILHEAATSGRISAEELPPSETKERLVEVHCAPIRDEAGQPTGAVAVLRDVTDLRRLERARRELTANVSHELRTPLTSIKGFVETLLGGAMRDEAAARHFLEIISKETNRLVKLTDDLLDLSRLESKRITLDLQQVRVGEVVADTVAKMQPLAGRRALELRAGEQHVTVLADRDRLAQVLTNLLDNAIKFTPDHGTIAVGWRTLNGEVEIEVADTGPGISPADLPHIFERFYKADRARPATPGGSGLGLAITKHIVEAHGGRIRVASAPGAGTTFAFTLPRDTD
ncbi:MAG: ATP-binding protein [Armatimonadota bacterium]|nr:ATP-binding protein [Armatimonadota bacterium]MDR7518943.1 ATP-binding protein [Armatimonadota bacterium]